MTFPERSTIFLKSNIKIWDHAKHNALTDLIFFKDRWLCVFRESDAHVYGLNGIIRIIASTDGHHWQSIAAIEEQGIDLRDPKLSETPDGRLMLLAGGTQYEGRKYITRQPRVAFSDDGVHWTKLTPVLVPHEWLWRVTWHNGKAYGASYRHSDPNNFKAEWIITLFESSDGLNYRYLNTWDIPGYPSETTLRFLPSGKAVALVRREDPQGSVDWIGTSTAPYYDWDWQPTHHHLAGPNFLILDDQTMWAAGRVWQHSQPKTAICQMSLSDLNPLAILPSGGDTSYPGMVYRQGELWVSYYSSHEGKAAVYLARVSLK